MSEENIKSEIPELETPVKRKRGRPRKDATMTQTVTMASPLVGVSSIPTYEAGKKHLYLYKVEVYADGTLKLVDKKFCHGLRELRDYAERDVERAIRDCSSRLGS